MTRCEATGQRLTIVSRFTIHGSWERAENDADVRRSFAAVERSMPDRLLAGVTDSRAAAPELARQLERFRQEPSTIPALMAPQNLAQSLAARSELMRDSGVGRPNHDR